MSELLTSLSGKTVHMVGIGGISMSGLSEILLSMGIHVTGSDVKNSPIVERLKLKNVPVFLKQEPSNITNQDLVVYTAAMPTDHPELEAARKKAFPLLTELRYWAKSCAVTKKALPYREPTERQQPLL
ncbi:Mur ligase domain-containing protein [Thermoclostridium stercorarium]